MAAARAMSFGTCRIYLSLALLVAETCRVCRASSSGEPVLLSAPVSQGKQQDPVSAAEKALMKSKQYHAMQARGDAPIVGHGQFLELKERMLARLSGKPLVETKIEWSDDGQSHSEIAVVGSWGEWMAVYQLTKTAGNKWVSNINIPVGRHMFKFLIDGEWRVSRNYEIVDDGVGTGGNNRLEVSRRIVGRTVVGVARVRSLSIDRMRPRRAYRVCELSQVRALSVEEEEAEVSTRTCTQRIERAMSGTYTRLQVKKMSEVLQALSGEEKKVTFGLPLSARCAVLTRRRSSRVCTSR
eukprot:2834195-Rhodomonas_salina.1